jgi:hypothetical protein
MNPENFYFSFSSDDFTNGALADDATIVACASFFFSFPAFKELGKF